MQPLLKFIRLPHIKRQHILKTFALLLVIRLGLFLLPFKQLQKGLAQLSPPPSPASSNFRPKGAQTVIWAVNVCSRYMPGHVKCLARALTTQVLLCRRGYAPDLRIGVAKDANNRLEAHAWIELKGVVVMGFVSDLDRFTPMPSLPQLSETLPLSS